MDNQKLVSVWQIKIREICEEKLARPLSPLEWEFISETRGFLALEMIEDAVKQMPADKLTSYLESATSN